MKTLVLSCHPNPGSSVLGRELKQALSATGRVFIREVSELCTACGMQLTRQQIEAEEEMILQYDRIMLFSPLYWMGVSALGRFYLEQILTPGFAMRKDGALPQTDGKHFMVVATAGCSNKLICEEEYGTAEQLFKAYSFVCKKCHMVYDGAVIICSDDNIQQKAAELVARL